jgi:hypothetical protein
VQWPPAKKPVTIPDGVTVIGSHAFYDVEQTDRVIIPRSVISIEDYALYGMRLQNVTLPDNLTAIGEWAFANNRLTAVAIPKNITVIGERAFGNNRLTEITLPTGINVIKAFAFADNLLTAVTIPSGVDTIKLFAFDKNPLTSITIGANVTLDARSGDAGILGYDTSFDKAYNNGGKQAGRYTRTNSESTTWTRNK